MTKSFDHFPLFMLMAWADTHNYNADYDLIVDYKDMPGEFDPFQPMPEDYTGNLNDWHAELNEFEEEFKREYILVCEKIYGYCIANALKIEKLSMNYG